MGKQSSHDLDTKDFFYSILKFLTYKGLFLSCLPVSLLLSLCLSTSSPSLLLSLLLSLPLSCPSFFLSPILLLVRVFVYMCDDLRLHIFSLSQSLDFFLIVCDQQITSLLLFAVCTLCLPPGVLAAVVSCRTVCPFLVVVGWYFLGLLTCFDICLSPAITWHWWCFLISTDKELAFWYLLSWLLWEWHSEEEANLET